MDNTETKEKPNLTIQDNYDIEDLIKKLLKLNDKNLYKSLSSLKDAYTNMPECILKEKFATLFLLLSTKLSYEQYIVVHEYLKLNTDYCIKAFAELEKIKGIRRSKRIVKLLKLVYRNTRDKTGQLKLPEVKLIVKMIACLSYEDLNKLSAITDNLGAFYLAEIYGLACLTQESDLTQNEAESFADYCKKFVDQLNFYEKIILEKNILDKIDQSDILHANEKAHYVNIVFFSIHPQGVMSQ